MTTAEHAGPPTLPPAGTHEELLAQVALALDANGARVAAAQWRQGFHIQPPTGLLNDPNGLVQHEGVYHVFYQWYPFAPAHKAKFWAHMTSTDLVHWDSQPVALAPDSWYDAQGCYSGSAVVANGVVHLLYTGNVRSADGGRYPQQCLAVLEADGSVTKYAGNPLVGPLPGFSPHVRDPKVFRRGGSWWMVLGAQTEDLNGALALLRSADLHTWELVGQAAGGSSAGAGYMWECPDLITLAGQDVLLISPQYDLGEDAGADQFRDVSRYTLGTLDTEAGTFTHGELFDADFGPDFYAPQTFTDESGRTIIIGWMGMPDHPTQPELGVKHPTVADGWVHCLTVPRVLTQRDGVLHQAPVPELAALRGRASTHREIRLAGGETILLPDVRGERVELEIAATCAPGASLKVSVRADADSATVICANASKGTVEVDTTRSGAGVGGKFATTVPTGESVTLRALIDTSSIELFVNDGARVFSARIYPGQGATGIRLGAAGGDVVLDEVTCYQLRTP